MRRRVAIGVALAVASTLGGAVFALTPDGTAPAFCTMALAVREVQLSPVDVRIVALEDQGQPGRDDCDKKSVPRAGTDHPVLGFDCAVRDHTGHVLGTTTPNRPGGTCGQ